MATEHGPMDTELAGKRRQREPTAAEANPKASVAWRRLALRALHVAIIQAEIMILGGLGAKTSIIISKQATKILVNRDSDDSWHETIKDYHSKLHEEDYQEASRRSRGPKSSASTDGWEKVTSPDRQASTPTTRAAPPPPPDRHLACSCGLETVILRSRKQGDNYLRLFYRCQKSGMAQCPFFAWLPDIDQDQWVSRAHVETPRRGKDDCGHQNVTRAGSNAFLQQLKCKDWPGLVLERTKVQPTQKGAEPDPPGRRAEAPRRDPESRP